MPSYPYRIDPATGLTTATDPPLFIPPHPRATIEMFEQRGHAVSVRRSRGGSLRYTLDQERERTALALSNRYARLYGG